MIDTHAHLDALDDEPASRRRARARGRRVAHPHRRHRRRGQPARARARRRARRASTRCSASTRTGRPTRPTTTSRRSATLLAHPKAVGAGEMGLDWFRDYAPRDKQLQPVRRDARRRRRHRQAGGDPHARGRRRHARRARRLRRHGRPALLLLAAPAASGARARLVRLVRRQRDVPEGRRPAARRARGAGRPHPRRDRRAVPRTAGRARQAQRAGVRHAHARGACGGANEDPPSSSGRSSATLRVLRTAA